MVSKKKYEKCVKSVKSKQPKSCENKKWKGKGCYNPWAICTKNLGGKPRRVGRPRKSKSKSKRKSKRKSRTRRSVGRPSKSKSKSRRRVGRPRKSKSKSRSRRPSKSKSKSRTRRGVGRPSKSKSKSKSKSRKRVGRPRKSKRKNRSRRSVGKSRRSSSSKDKCEKSSLKKYINRNGPPFPAQNCKNVSKRGNDGENYKSKPDKNGIYKWIKV